MPYIGRGLTTGAQYQKLDDIAINNATTFTMSVGSANVSPDQNHLILVVNGVIQEPGTGFTVSGSTCTLASAITTSGHSGLDTIYGVIAGDAAYAAYDSIGANALGVTAGTVTASRAIVPDGNKDIASFRNVTLTGELDAATLDISGNADIDGTTNLDAVDIDGAVQIDSTVTVGVDDTGYDVKFFGATASAYMLWDASTDDLVLAGAAGIDLAGDLDVDGTANLDVVDIDGAVDMASTLAVAGDVTISSATSTKPHLTITNTNADGSAPQFIMKKDSASPADNDEVGRIYMYGDDDAGNPFESVLIRGITTDVSNGSEDSRLEFLTYKAGTQTSTLSLDSGAVGIGTATPTAGGASGTPKLHVNGAVRIDGNVAIAPDSGTPYISGGSTGTQWRNNANGSTLLTILDGGNVGIGTTNPEHLLHVEGDNKAIEVHSADYSNIRLGAAGSSGGDLDKGVILIRENGSNKSQITGTGVTYFGGNVGIGTTSPHGTLHVFTETDDTDESTNVALTLGSSAAGKMKMYFGINDANDYTYIGSVETAIAYRNLVLQPNGSNVGIGLDGTGDNAIVHKLQVESNGNTYVQKIQNAHGSTPYGLIIDFDADPNTTNYPFIAGEAAGTDRFKIYSDGSYSDISDEREKENIKDTESQLANINKLEIKDYNRIGDKSKGDHIGVIAQQIEPIYPHLVRTSDDEQKTKMVYKIGLISPLIKAVQELSTANDALKSRIEALENA